MYRFTFMKFSFETVKGPLVGQWEATRSFLFHNLNLVFFIFLLSLVAM